MVAVVLSNYLGSYTLRHIIYDIEKSAQLADIKEAYYKDYQKTNTDTFILCNSVEEVKEVLVNHGIKAW